MFSCCDAGFVIDTIDEDDNGQTIAMELHESTPQLNLLFNALHHLPHLHLPSLSPHLRSSNARRSLPQHPP